MSAIYQYWGKVSPQDNQSQNHYHLLPYHSLDVASVAYHLFDIERPLAQDMADYLGFDRENFRNLILFVVSLHDLGKFANAFQGLYQDVASPLLKVNTKLYPYNMRHDALGWGLYRHAFHFGQFCELSERRQLGKGLDILMNAVLGHHGMPIIPKDNRESVIDNQPEKIGVGYNKAIDSTNQQVANEWIQTIKTFFGVETTLKQLAVKAQDMTWLNALRHISWQISGLTMLADWVGSDVNYFHYESQKKPLDEYWQIALKQAKQALKDKGLLILPSISQFSSVQTVFGFEPTPLQAWAEQVTLLEFPQLFILEDITGAGKTEAALTVAHRLIAKGLADGFYFGLPTTATSNAMFNRINDYMPKLFNETDTDKRPSLVLAHNSRKMNASFQTLLNQQTSNRQADEDITHQCNAWFATSSKRALLANIGVGTIDQVLLATLPKKHQPLRLLGLFRKILILDEIHSADPYMFELLKSVLKVHLHQGGYAILLTATLNQEKRESLAKLWTQTDEKSATLLTNSQAFPLATQINADDNQVIETPLASPQKLTRSVKVDFIHTTLAVTDYLMSELQQGCCAVWVRNTVQDAIDAYHQMLDRGIKADDILLFHSRFTQLDRGQIEQQVLDTFGKASNSTKRRGKLLIATQVFQESLDADADIMVSDLCPIDYLIQRAGRLHRHKRDANGNPIDTTDARPAPVLKILAPVFDNNPDSKWYSKLFTTAQYVYRHVGQLWLTMQILQQKGEIKLPQDARELIESVYSSQSQSQIPHHLEQASIIENSANKARSSRGKTNRIQWDKGYHTDSGLWTSDTTTYDDISSRLQEIPTEEIVVLTEQNGKLDFYAPEPFAIERSIIKISEKRASKMKPLDTEQQNILKKRFPVLAYKQLWLATDDGNFGYDPSIGLYDKNNTATGSDV